MGKSRMKSCYMPLMASLMIVSSLGCFAAGDPLANPNNYTAEMISIPAGDFLMGNSEVGNDAAYHFAAELPQHSVTLSAYSISKYEVTRAEYKKFVDAGGYEKQANWSAEGWKWKTDINRKEPMYYGDAQYWGAVPGWFSRKDSHPMAGMTYYEAEAFCIWAGGKLPSEAQWEKAARWNAKESKPNIYPWGEKWAPGKCNGWDEPSIPGYQTAIAGSFSGDVSTYGCQDMGANLSEWCRDWYDSGYFTQTPDGGWRDPQGPATGKNRVLKGGSWGSTEGECRCAYRTGLPPTFNFYSTGFRIVR